MLDFMALRTQFKSFWFVEACSSGWGNVLPLITRIARAYLYISAFTFYNRVPIRSRRKSFSFFMDAFFLFNFVLIIWSTIYCLLYMQKNVRVKCIVYFPGGGAVRTKGMRDVTRRAYSINISTDESVLTNTLKSTIRNTNILLFHTQLQISLYK